jgi:hypothetical protein
MSPLNLLVGQHPVLDAPVVRAAYLVAARAHAGQARKSGEPVLSHCLATAVVLAELGLPEETVAAGLLHDVLSDTGMTACQLEEYVPRSCVELVGGRRRWRALLEGGVPCGVNASGQCGRGSSGEGGARGSCTCRPHPHCAPAHLLALPRHAPARWRR